MLVSVRSLAIQAPKNNVLNFPAINPNANCQMCGNNYTSKDLSFCPECNLNFCADCCCPCDPTHPEEELIAKVISLLGPECSDFAARAPEFGTILTVQDENDCLLLHRGQLETFLHALPVIDDIFEKYLPSNMQKSYRAAQKAAVRHLVQQDFICSTTTGIWKVKIIPFTLEQRTYTAAVITYLT